MNNNEQLRIAVIEKLRAAGVSIHDDSKTPSIISAIEKLTGRRCTYAMSPSDFVRAYVSPVAPARQAVEFKPMRAMAHPRLFEIERDQPPMMTPNGTGNHNQYSQFMLDNGRTR